MEEVWQRIESWLRDAAPKRFRLTPGASEGEIRAAESTIGCHLPEDVRESYRVHNGSNRIWLVEQGYLMPLEPPHDLPRRQRVLFRGVVESWQAMQEMLARGYFDTPGGRSRPKGPIKKDWWNPRWIPITDNQCGDSLGLDMDPAKGGQVGQVISWWHERGLIRVLATNLRSWLSGVADDLEAGRCRFDERAGAILKATY